MNGGWVIADKLYMPALLVTASTAGSLPGLSFERLDVAALPDPGDVELLLLGTGDAMRQPSDAMLLAAARRGWRLAAMDNGAAARTFNVLMAEERLVGALLLAEGAAGPAPGQAPPA